MRQRYYHGGLKGLDKRRPAVLRPPAETGYEHHLGAVSGVEHPDHRTDRVYLTTDPDIAKMYALVAHPDGGSVYEVVPVGDIEHDPDWKGDPGVSVQVPLARIRRVRERRVTRWQGLTAREVVRHLLQDEA